MKQSSLNSNRLSLSRKIVIGISAVLLMAIASSILIAAISLSTTTPTLRISTAWVFRQTRQRRPRCHWISGRMRLRHPLPRMSGRSVRSLWQVRRRPALEARIFRRRRQTVSTTSEQVRRRWATAIERLVSWPRGRRPPAAIFTRSLSTTQEDRSPDCRFHTTSKSTATAPTPPAFESSFTTLPTARTGPAPEVTS
jgi:hypothetical protein